MPASRSARAITFAPRSCPSSPTFAITTRTRPAIRRRASRATRPTPPSAHRTSLRGSRRPSRRRRSPEAGSCRAARRPPSAVRAPPPPPAQRPHPLDLLALERRVDLEQRRLVVLVDGEPVDADDHALPRLDLLLVAKRRLRDLALEEVVLDRGPQHRKT